MNLEKEIGRVCVRLYEEIRARRATKYLSPDFVVKASRQHPGSKSLTSSTLVVTIGRPNYAERAFIARAREAGETFPIRKVLLKFDKP